MNKSISILLLLLSLSFSAAFSQNSVYVVGLWGNTYNMPGRLTDANNFSVQSNYDLYSRGGLEFRYTLEEKNLEIGGGYTHWSKANTFFAAPGGRVTFNQGKYDGLHAYAGYTMTNEARNLYFIPRMGLQLARFDPLNNELLGIWERELNGNSFVSNFNNELANSPFAAGFLLLGFTGDWRPKGRFMATFAFQYHQGLQERDFIRIENDYGATNPEEIEYSTRSSHISMSLGIGIRISD